MEVRSDHHFHLHPQFIYESFHIVYIIVTFLFLAHISVSFFRFHYFSLNYVAFLKFLKIQDGCH